MMTQPVVYSFVLKSAKSRKFLRALLDLALKETELIFGKARLKLETSYRVSPRGSVCAIEGGTDCGEHLAKLLSGFLIKQVGEDGFRVHRIALTERTKP